MKHLKRITFGILFAFMMMLHVSAAEVSNYADLKACLETDGSTCTLKANVELDNTIEIAEDVTLDLNGYTISLSDTYAGIDSMFVVLHGGKLTVNDSSAAKTGKITTENSEDVFVGIKMTKAGGDNTLTATLVVNGGTIEATSYAISGNGNPGRENTDVTINGGTIKGESVGIFQPQVGKVTINGGKVTGASGIEMRAGELVVNGGTIEATATEVEINPNGNGNASKGVGIAVMQHTTVKPISVTVNDGEITGASALYQSNPQNNAADDIKKVDIAVKGGNFEATDENEKAVYSENVTEFVTGGTFNTKVEETLVADTLTTKEENGVVYVGKESNVTVKDATNGEVKADRTTAVEGQTVTLTITAAKGYKLDKVVVKDADGKEVTVTDGKFVMPGSDVEVSATFVEDVTVTPDVPKTGDSVMLFVVLGFMSIAAIAVASNNLKKRTTR